MDRSRSRNGTGVAARCDLLRRWHTPVRTARRGRLRVLLRDPAFDARIAYDAARTRGRSPKAAHGVAMKAAQKALRAAGESGSGWDQATAAQEAYGD